MRQNVTASGHIPVQIVNIERGSLVARRTFSGTLEARARFNVAAKVSGRIEQLTVDLADPVERGQTVAQLDDDEYQQAVAVAEAELAVAKANRVEAENALTISNRGLERVRTLRERGVASESQVDTARAEQLADEAALAVAEAEVTRAEASLATARIRLGYTTVTADWAGGNERRVVAERYINVGDTVSENTPLISVVELDPLTGVIFVSEKDYGQLSVDQTVTLRTDAYPDRTFEGRIERIAPVF